MTGKQGLITEQFSRRSTIRSSNTLRSRHKETLITRLRLGHCDVITLLHRLQIVKDDKCATCEIKEDIQHLFFDCPRQADLQLQLQMLGATDLKSALLIPACTDAIYKWASENNIKLKKHLDYIPPMCITLSSILWLCVGACIYVCIYISIYIYVYIYMYVCIYICICASPRIEY